MEKMDNPLPQSGYAAHAGRIALAAQVRSVMPMNLMQAIAQEWPAKLGKAQALAHARALVDMIEGAK